MKYNSKWRSKETDQVYEIGQKYTQGGVEYFFLNSGMYSKFLSKEVIEMYFEEVSDKVDNKVQFVWYS